MIADIYFQIGDFFIIYFLNILFLAWERAF